MRVSVAIALLLSGCATAASQGRGLVDVRAGWSSDSAIAAVREHYEVIDTISSFDGSTRIIRIAPVALAGVDGFLVLHVDTTNTVDHLHWTRMPAGRYSKSEALAKYTGWDRWQSLSESQSNAMMDALRRELGDAPVRRLIPMDVSASSDADQHAIRLLTWSDSGSRIEAWFRPSYVEWNVVRDTQPNHDWAPAK